MCRNGAGFFIFDLGAPPPLYKFTPFFVEMAETTLLKVHWGKMRRSRRLLIFKLAGHLTFYQSRLKWGSQVSYPIYGNFVKMADLSTLDE